MDGTSPIPVINLASGEAPEVLAQQVLHAVATVGFLSVKLDGLGITREDINRTFDISHELFKTPGLENYPRDEVGNNYIAAGTTTLAEKTRKKGDSKANFGWGRFSPPDTESTSPIPPVLQKHKAALDDYHAKCCEAANRILDLFSIALNLPKTYFRERHSPGYNSVTLIDYPYIPPENVDDSNDSIRAGEHKDWGSLTLLAQEEDGTPGLEVFLPDAAVDAAEAGTGMQRIEEIDFSKGKWYPAPNMPDAVLVNVGMALEAWTGGQLRATLHRVVFPKDDKGGYKARKSIPFFVQPTHSVKFHPISSDGSIDTTADAPTSGEFFQERQRAIQVPVGSTATAAY